MIVRMRAGVLGTALASFVLVVLAGPARGAEPGPLDQVRESTDKLLAFLKDPALKAPEKRAERRAKIIAAIDERFNWPDMAQRSLGVHWTSRMPEQRQEFIKLFTELLRHTYLTKIEGYAGEKMHYKGERVEGNYARVEVTLVTTKNMDVPIEYSLRRSDGQWLIYDVAIEGVRLVNNYRSQFSSMLDKMAYPKFVEKLKARVAELEAEDAKGGPPAGGPPPTPPRP